MNNNLYAVTVIFNPIQYNSRYRLYKEFEKRCIDLGIILYTVEAIFEGQRFMVTSSNRKEHIQLKASSVLWHKESMLNIGIRSLPEDAKYISWIDADILFCNPNIVEDTINCLERYDIIQMFETCNDLDSSNNLDLLEPTKISFCKNISYNDEPDFDIYNGHPGYAWAMKKDVYERIGGLLDTCILGTSDTHMAHSFVGIHSDYYNPYFSLEYKSNLEDYLNNCIANNLSLGFVPGLILHYYHGKKSNRLYDIRDEILVSEKFNPYEDLIKEENGLYKFKGNKPDLEEFIISYFYNRSEDEGLSESFFGY